MIRPPVPLLAIALLATALAAAPRPAWSAWPHEPAVNVPVCTPSGTQESPTITSDGAGGAIVTWHDYRSGTSYDIYAQRISATGAVQWTADGVALCTATGEQKAPTITSDGAGGAIVTWYDYRSGNYDIYAQRISATGAVQWTANGVAICTSVTTQYGPTLVSDGAGGAIVTWYDYRSGTNYDIYAQRISANGVVQWTANGVPLCTATSDQYACTIASDDAGGAIVTWQDQRSGNGDIYAQRISAAGTVQWMANGVALCTAASEQSYPTLASDGAGAAIVTWYDYRSGTSYDVYTQRVSASGAVQWTANGVALCTATGDQYYPTLVSDGAGGAIVTWYDYRSGNSDIYAQRISATGTVQWTANGVPLCTSVAAQYRPTVVSDGTGGAIVTWHDYRSGNSDIYAQRISATGAVQWTANGVALCTAILDQMYPTLVSDGACGAIVTWHDGRSGNSDIYAQRVDEWGYLGAEPAIASVRDIPNDEGGLVKVSWNASPLDVDPLFRNVDNYLVFRSAPPNLAARAIRSGATLTQDPGEAASLPGRLLVTTSGMLTYYWEYVGAQEAYHLPAYSMVAPTTGDSIADSNPVTAFLVQAWAVGGTQWWSSAPDSGYSVDDLAPPAPAPFTGEYTDGTAILQWAVNPAVDLAGYRLYRGSTADFVPEPANLVAAQSNTSYVDVAGAPYYYKLCALDLHGNVSSFSTLLPSGTTDAPGPVLPRAVSLAAPAPNPTRGATTLRFGLPRAAHVELALYDQQGRRVRSLVASTQPAGERTLTWDGCDESGRTLPAGLYFVRLMTEGRTFVSRLALIH